MKEYRMTMHDPEIRRRLAEMEPPNFHKVYRKTKVTGVPGYVELTIHAPHMSAERRELISNIAYQRGSRP